MSIKLADIAQQANVSVSLVSRVLNEDVTLKIRPATRARILQQWERLTSDQAPGGDDAAGPARHRRTRRMTRRLTRNVLFPVPQVFDPHGQSTTDPYGYINSLFLRHFQRRLQDDRLRLSIRYFGLDERSELIDDLLISRGRYWDAVMVTPDLLDKRLIQGLLERQIPHVFRGPDRHEVPLHSVTFNQVAVFDPVLDHLQSLGHKRIGYLGTASSERYRHGLQLAMARRQITPRPSWCALTDALPAHNRIWNAYNTAGVQHVKQLILDWVDGWKNRQPASRPTAMICSNDLLACGLVEAVKAHGLTPGRDLSIVGNDNIQHHGPDHLPESRKYALTTLDNPVDVNGRRCAERLINQILYQQHDIVHEYIPRQLVVRQTTGPARH